MAHAAQMFLFWLSLSSSASFGGIAHTLAVANATNSDLVKTMEAIKNKDNSVITVTEANKLFNAAIDAGVNTSLMEMMTGFMLMLNGVVRAVGVAGAVLTRALMGVM